MKHHHIYNPYTGDRMCCDDEMGFWESVGVVTLLVISIFALGVFAIIVG